MAKLAIFAKADNTHPDPTQDWRKFKRGDVIDVREDGFDFGKDVEGPNALGWWRVINVPGPASAYISLLQGDIPDQIQFNPNQPLRLRINKIDLDVVEASAGVLRVVDQIAIGSASLLATRSVKPAYPKVGVDGLPLVVIG